MFREMKIHRIRFFSVNWTRRPTVDHRRERVPIILILSNRWILFPRRTTTTNPKHRKARVFSKPLRHRYPIFIWLKIRNLLLPIFTNNNNSNRSANKIDLNAKLCPKRKVSSSTKKRFFPFAARRRLMPVISPMNTVNRSGLIRWIWNSSLNGWRRRRRQRVHSFWRERRRSSTRNFIRSSRRTSNITNSWKILVERRIARVMGTRVSLWSLRSWKNCSPSVINATWTISSNSFPKKFTNISKSVSISSDSRRRNFLNESNDWRDKFDKRKRRNPTISPFPSNKNNRCYSRRPVQWRKNFSLRTRRRRSLS